MRHARSPPPGGPAAVWRPAPRDAGSAERMAEVARVAEPAARVPWRPRVNWPQVGMLALIAAFGFYLVYPLVLILLNSFNTARIGQPPVYGVQAWVEAWSARGLLQ